MNLKTHSFDNNVFIFAGSVLWLQGKQIISQPLENDKSVFVYNGDIFGGNGINLRDVSIDGDTIHFWNGLDVNENIIDFLTHLEGPYAFIYLNKISKKLYFGRDPYGRRSLLLGKSNEIFVFSSVAKRTIDFKFIEIPTTGIFCYDLITRNFKLFSWPHKNLNFDTKLKELEIFLDINIGVINTSIESNYKTYLPPSTDELIRISNLTKPKEVSVFEKLFTDNDWMENLQLLKKLLETAIQKRIATQPKFCSMCILETTPCTHALTGVLFSGGVDCAILALLADKYTEQHRPIDLINVAFDESQNYKTPDRLTGLQTLDELKKLQPDRKWNFLEVNVTKDELAQKRKEFIADLIYPLNSVLDDSLGCALWFASRGFVNDYKSSCRVLLVGMGADELFGGYTKHRNALKRNGWRGLYDALEEDWQNLPHRNLSRDDRVVSDHGHQLRTPYLDENVVKFVRSLNVWEKYIMLLIKFFAYFKNCLQDLSSG